MCSGPTWSRSSEPRGVGMSSLIDGESPDQQRVEIERGKWTESLLPNGPAGPVIPVGSVPIEEPKVIEFQRQLGICMGCRIVGEVRPVVFAGQYRACVVGCLCPTGTAPNPRVLR